MQTLRLTSHVGPDGVLKLEVPIGRADADVDVLLVIEGEAPILHSWPHGFIDATAGAWKDDPMVREPQPSYDVRVELP